MATIGQPVIKDNECREYMEGWNANNCGKHFLSNPYSCLSYDGELNRLWEKGYNDNQSAWDNPKVCPDLPQAFSQEQVNDAFTITDHYNP